VASCSSLACCWSSMGRRCTVLSASFDSTPASSLRGPDHASAHWTPGGKVRTDASNCLFVRGTLSALPWGNSFCLYEIILCLTVKLVLQCFNLLGQSGLVPSPFLSRVECFAERRYSSSGFKCNSLIIWGPLVTFASAPLWRTPTARAL
jgi:hypothetical protein